MNFHKRVLAVPSVLLALLAMTATFGSGACGSSDSSGDAKDAGPDGLLWNAPGSIVSMTPANGDDNVSVHAPIQVTFSDPVQLGASPATLAGPGAAAIATTVKLSDDKKTITITPVSDLAAPTTLTLTLGDITTLLGAGVEKRPWSWTVPLWLRVGETLQPKYAGDDATGDPTWGIPAVAAGPNERVSVASFDGRMRVKTVDSYLGKWSALGGPLNDGRNPLLPSLLVDKGGALIAAFVDGENGHIARWNGTEWSLLADLGNLGTAFDPVFHHPTMAMDATGKLYVAYVARITDDSVGVYVKSFANGTWSVPELVDQGTSESYVEIALSTSGVPYVSYRNGTNVYVSLRSAEKAWAKVGGAVNPPNETAGGVKPVVAIDEVNRPVVLGCFNGRQFRRWDGLNWQTVGPLMPGSCDATKTYLKKIQGNHLIGFWTVPDAPRATINLADVTDTTWVPVDNPQGNTTDAFASSLAVDANDIPVIAWIEDTSLHIGRLNR